MSEDAQIQGVFAALPTPFDEGRQVDQSALGELLDYVSEQELHGVALLTEAGEDAFLSPDERAELIRFRRERLTETKAVIVSISSASSLDAVELAKVAEGSGAKAVLLAPTRVPGVGYRELYRHVDRVVRAASIPVLLTDRPENALASLEDEEVATLVHHIQLGGVFAPHARPEDWDRWSKLMKDEASLVSGCSLTLGRDHGHGVGAAVCGLSLLLPDRAAEIWRHVIDGNLSGAREVMAKVQPMIDHLGPAPVGAGPDRVKKLASKLARRSISGRRLDATYPAPALKEALRLQGHSIRPDVRPPFERLKPDAKERLRATLKLGGALS